MNRIKQWLAKWLNNELKPYYFRDLKSNIVEVVKHPIVLSNEFKLHNWEVNNKMIVDQSIYKSKTELCEEVYHMIETQKEVNEMDGTITYKHRIIITK